MSADEELDVEQRFATIPEWVLRAPVSASAVRTYATLQRFGNESGHRMPGRRELSGWMGCSLSSVTRAIAELETFGALRVSRDTRPGTGESRVITRNRYFLRTTDPSVGVLLPPSGVGHRRSTPRPRAAYVGRGCVSTEKEQLLPPPTPSIATCDALPVDNREGEEIPSAVLTAIDSVDALSDELRSVRRAAGLATGRWTTRRITTALVAAHNAGYEPDRMRDALHAIALDPTTATPGRLAHDGPWWDITDRRHAHGTADRLREMRAACQECDPNWWLTDHDGLPIAKCPNCHPDFHRQGATA